MARQREPIGGRTPEELETLLEDALVVGDGHALAGLFEDGATLLAVDGSTAKGDEAIAGLARRIWGGHRPSLTDPRHVVVARDLALVIGDGSMNVARRGEGGIWRYAIVLQSPDATDESATGAS